MARKRCTSIGGQAVIEGVMMRGTRSMATAVRDEKGNIVVESKYIKPTKDKNFLFRTPFLRGIFNFVGTMFMGVGTLLRSGEVFDGETQPSKVEKWFAKTFKVDVFSVVMAFAVVVGVALSLLLFYFLPQLAVTGIAALFKIDTDANIGVQIGMNLLEGAIRMLIFVAYIAATALMKDVRRTYMYHGAEHKTISCYEHGLELTVENARTMSTIHDRCGTTFMFLTMVISVLVFSLTGWSDQLWLRLLLRLALIPIVAGGKATNDWLKGALQAGIARDGKVDIYGPLREFPYVNQQDQGHIFKITGIAEGVTLDYVPTNRKDSAGRWIPGEWPVFENINGELVFEGMSMFIRAQSGQTMGATVTDVTAEIPSYTAKGLPLLIKGKSQAPLQTMAQWVNNSPVSSMIGNAFVGTQASGDA